MTITIDDVVKALGDMPVIKLIELTKDLEKKWDLKAEPQVQQITPTTLVETGPIQTEFAVVLMSVPADKKMTVIKLVRDLTGLGLMESKQLVEGAPKSVKEGVSKDEAEDLKTKLVAAGAVVELK